MDRRFDVLGREGALGFRAGPVRRIVHVGRFAAVASGDDAAPEIVALLLDGLSHLQCPPKALVLDHGTGIHGGESVVDTRLSENLIQHATGTDLLIHQVAAVRPQLLALPVFQTILAHHTKPEEAGIVFARTKPRLAVFYHFSLLGTPQVPPMTEPEVVDLTRKTYGGPLLVGEDLMVFRIGQAAVHVGR